MKKSIISTFILLGSSLLADTTMCFKENHPSIATIESTPLNGGACAGKYSINDMKKKGWLVDDIKINGNSYIYILKTPDNAKAITPSGISQEQMEANIMAKLEAKKEAEETARVEKESEELRVEAQDLYVAQCQNCHGEKGESRKGNSRLKDLTIADMQEALREYKLGVGEKASSVYAPVHINFLNDKSIKGIKAYLDSIQ
ncbi:c-type cytochrome [Aliarcobacter vitoriensis]|uniref:Cytochrome c domain-containing protein n=1 Tax=Aliarcobacter vitoriensis TaxID=2011099 RepID=A0A366MRE9_9BACT|nr:c-type cytochrome [Aliarcobacter vitoriensis]RBQ28878.1 hypothetical protein CRU91_06800 [Aliarcobacter vitoriensis]RBQ31066.1 hypothetical protein CRU92_09150 [Arcobacter sp. FW59]